MLTIKETEKSCYVILHQFRISNMEDKVVMEVLSKMTILYLQEVETYIYKLQILHLFTMANFSLINI